MKNLNKIGVQIELPEAIFQEVAKVATSIEECIRLAQCMFYRLPLEWQNTIWERMGDGEDLSMYGKRENEPSDEYFRNNFARIFAEKYLYINGSPNTNYIWNCLESNFHNKLNNLIDSITLYPMLADYEMPEGDVDHIQVLVIPIDPVMDRFNSRFSQD